MDRGTDLETAIYTRAGPPVFSMISSRVTTEIPHNPTPAVAASCYHSPGVSRLPTTNILPPLDGRIPSQQRLHRDRVPSPQSELPEALRLELRQSLLNMSMAGMDVSVEVSTLLAESCVNWAAGRRSLKVEVSEDLVRASLKVYERVMCRGMYDASITFHQERRDPITPSFDNGVPPTPESLSSIVPIQRTGQMDGTQEAASSRGVPSLSTDHLPAALPAERGLRLALLHGCLRVEKALMPPIDGATLLHLGGLYAGTESEAIDGMRLAAAARFECAKGGILISGAQASCAPATITSDAPKELPAGLKPGREHSNEGEPEFIEVGAAVPATPSLNVREREDKVHKVATDIDTSDHHPQTQPSMVASAGQFHGRTHEFMLRRAVSGKPYLLTVIRGLRRRLKIELERPVLTTNNIQTSQLLTTIGQRLTEMIRINDLYDPLDTERAQSWADKKAASQASSKVYLPTFMDTIEEIEELCILGVDAAEKDSTKEELLDFQCKMYLGQHHVRWAKEKSLAQEGDTRAIEAKRRRAEAGDRGTKRSGAAEMTGEDGVEDYEEAAKSGQHVGRRPEADNLVKRVKRH